MRRLLAGQKGALRPGSGSQVRMWLAGQEGASTLLTKSTLLTCERRWACSGGGFAYAGCSARLRFEMGAPFMGPLLIDALLLLCFFLPIPPSFRRNFAIISHPDAGKTTLVTSPGPPDASAGRCSRSLPLGGLW